MDTVELGYIYIYEKLIDRDKQNHFLVSQILSSVHSLIQFSE